MSESKWLCTCKSVRNYYQHPTEVDSGGRCVHCKYYAIISSKSKKKIEIIEDFDELDTSYLSKNHFDLNLEMDASEELDELLEYNDELKVLEQ